MTGPQAPPKLVVTDLDGTFLSPDGTVSATNAAAVRAAQRAGVPVLFATGRPVRWLEVIADLPGAHPSVIASNGAVLYDLAERRVLDSVPLPLPLAAEVTAAVRAAVPGVRFGFEDGERFGFEDGYLVAETLSQPALHRGVLADLVAAGPYVKILVRHRDLSADELAAAVLAAVGPTVTVTHSMAAEHGLAEISAAGVSKASMLQRCCDPLGIDAADVAAFGDMPNDVDMLGWVGRPYVMANAHPSLLDGSVLTATVAGSNAESGVGRTLLEWFG